MGEQQTILNAEIDNKTSSSLIEVRREAIGKEKKRQSIGKLSTTRTETNPFSFINCPIAIQYPTNKMPFNIFRDYRESAIETLLSDDTELEKSTDQRNRPNFPSPDGVVYSCPFLSQRLAWCNYIPDEFRQFLVFTNEVDLSIFSNTSIGDKQTYQVAEFRCPLFKKAKVYIPLLVGKPLEAITTNYRAKGTGVFGKLPPLSVDSLTAFGAIDDLTSSPIWSRRGSPIHTSIICLKCGAVKGQLGLEPTYNMYIEHLVEISREVMRVLKPEGSYLLVLGDTFAGSGMGWAKDGTRFGVKLKKAGEGMAYPEGKPPQYVDHSSEDMVMRPKQKLLIPFRVAMALQEDGWILRDSIVWHKPNSMPGSQKDRLTCTTEQIFRFVKNDKTILWRNSDTGEWRDTKPTKEESYPWGGIFQHVKTGVFRWDKPPENERDMWNKFQPLWMGFDHYFDLDAIRMPHRTHSLERYQRGVNLGRPAVGKSAEVGPMQQYTRAPRWFKDMFDEDHEYKGKFDDMLGHGPNSQSFNLRVRDCKRGKGGAFVQGGEVKELSASEQEVEEYQYPEGMERHHGSGPQYKLSGLGRADDLTKHDRAVGRTGDVSYTDPLHTKEYHQAGRNPGDVIETEARDRPLVAPHHPYRGDGWEKQAIEGREKGKYGEANVSRTVDGLHDNRWDDYFHEKGKNPGDVIMMQNAPHRKGRDYKDHEKFAAQQKQWYRGKHEDNPLGRNPGDVVEITGANSKYPPHEPRHFELQSMGIGHGGHAGKTVRHDHPMGKNPGDYVEYPDDPGDFWSLTTQPFPGQHFAVFPEKLCVMPILACSRPGDTVLDPFGGSGTTAVVAKKLGRKSIIIDVVEKYCTIAKNRVKQTVANVLLESMSQMELPLDD